MSYLQKVVEEIGLSGVANLYVPPVSPQAVHKWLSAGVPFERCLAIERAGYATRKQLRPDDWAEIWPELAENDCLPGHLRSAA